MTALSVFVDGLLKARVCTDGLDVLTVNISGTMVDETFAAVEFSGGSYPEGGDAKYLTWLNDLEVHSGQRVRVEVESSGVNSHPGRTIEELFPDHPEEKVGPMPSREQLIEEVKLCKRIRERFALSVQSSSGAHVSAEIGPEKHGFGASFIWNWIHPERVSASLHTYTLDQLASQEGLDYHFQEHLQLSAWAEVRINA